MRLEDFQRKLFNEFFGLYSRGEMDQTPENHFSDCLNIDYDIGEWKTRPGLKSHIPLGYGGKVLRFACFTSDFGPIVLILDDAGNLYTYSARNGDTATIPRITSPGATDFSALKILGKIFIGFHDGNFGLPGENLKVFLPDAVVANDEFRNAAGVAPTSTPLICTDGALGIVNAGTYKIAVAFLTSSGYITQPGPKNGLGIFTPTVYVAPGAKTINVNNIPIGPAGTASRLILSTKAGGEEFFFVSSTFGGILDNNIGTFTSITFDDTTDLVDSADYLFDLLEKIPAPLTLHDYNDRLVLGGSSDFASTLKISNPGEPETIDAIDGLYSINKDDGFTIRNVIVLRRSLYIWKNLGVWNVVDNDDFPSTWDKATPVDETVNTGVHGIAEFFNLSGIRIARDWTLIVDKSGILLFDGILRKPPITDKINNIWQSINFAQYQKIVIVVDEQLHKIYCALPINSSTENNLLLMGDYNLCAGKIPEYSKIKWAKWEFKPCGVLRRPTTIGLFGFPPDVVPTFKFSSIDSDGKIWSLNPFQYYDDETDIESFFQTSLTYWEPGYVHFFTASRLRVIGAGTILVTIEGLDAVLTANCPSIMLSTINFRFTLESLVSGINGLNAVFNLCTAPADTLLAGFQNGLLLLKNTDYTIIGTVVTMTTAPAINDTLQFLYRLGSIASTFKLEVPTGLINGINATYNLSSVPSDIYVAGWQNGLLLKNGLDFTVAGSTITMTVAPLVGDTLQFLFHSDSVQPGFILETPAGAVDASNTIFVMSNNPGDNFIAVFQNGLILRDLIDYHIIGNTLTMSAPPNVADSIQTLYRVSTVQNLGQEKLIRFNFQNEKARLKFRLTTGRFVVSKIELFGKAVYQMRPM